MIAITGGRGFVGKALVQKLSQNNKVISIVKGHMLQDKGNYFYVGHKHPDLKEILNREIIFIHAAGKVTRNQVELEHANIDTIQEFVNLLPNNLTRVIHISSANVHFTEHNRYGQSKKDGEKIWKNSPFANRLLILRPTWIYGPGDHHNSYPLIQNLERFPFLPLPTAPIRPVFIKDFVDLIANLAVQSNLGAHSWTVSGARITSLLEISRILVHGIGKRSLLIPIPSFGLRMAYRVTKLLGLQKLSERMYGFQIPKIWHNDAIWEMLPREMTHLDIGLRQTLAEYQATNP